MLSALLSPTVGGTQTADFVDSYGYDAQNREVSISQAFGTVDYVEGMKVGFGYMRMANWPVSAAGARLLP